MKVCAEAPFSMRFSVKKRALSGARMVALLFSAQCLSSKLSYVSQNLPENAGGSPAAYK